jgi:peptidoglycan hydrolase-like protein with peptidoglycan-binding domain
MKNNLNEEILRQLSLIKFDRGKTISENDYERKTFMFESEGKLINEQTKTKWCDSKESAEIKGMLYSQGFFPLIKYGCDGGSNMFPYGYDNMNQALSDSALLVMRKLTETVYDYIGKSSDAELKVSVLGGGGGGTQQFNKFGDTMIDALKGQVSGAIEYRDVNLKTFETKKVDFKREPFNTFVLIDFYFNYGKISTIDKYGQNEYFETNPYDFFNRFFNRNAAKANTSIITVNMIYKPKVVSAGSSMWEKFLGDYGYKGGVINKKDYGKTNWLGEPKGQTLDLGQVGPGQEINTDKIVSSLHWVLPALSMASMFINFGLPGIGVVVGSAIESIDAALYLLYDDDPYMAGIAMIFALIPLHELRGIPGFNQFIKKAAKGESEAIYRLLMKAKKTPKLLTNEERILLKNLSTDPKVSKLVYQEITNQLTERALSKASSKTYVKFIGQLIENGLLKPNMAQTILGIWGSTYLFDYMAYESLGKCSSTFNLDDLTKLAGIHTKEIPKEVGNAEKFLREKTNSLIKNTNPQPFTMSKEECNAVAEKLLLDNMLAQLENLKKEFDKIFADMTITYLKSHIKNNKNLSTKDSSTYQLSVVLMQNLLVGCFGVPYMGINYEVDNLYEKTNKLTQKGIPKVISNLISKNSNKNITQQENPLGNYVGTKITLENVNNVKKIEILSNEGVLSTYSKIVETILPSGKNKITTKKLMVGTGFKIRIEYLDGDIKTSDVINPNPYIDSLVGAIFNKGNAKQRIIWGYFDETTKVLVEEFQAKYGLKVDGEVKKQTFEKMIEVIKNKSCGTLKNISGKEIPLEINPEDIVTGAVKWVQGNWETTTRPVPELSEDKKDETEDRIKLYIDIDNASDFIDYTKIVSDTLLDNQ